MHVLVLIDTSFTHIACFTCKIHLCYIVRKKIYCNVWKETN